MPRCKLGEHTGSEAQRTQNERREQSCCAVPTSAFASASCLDSCNVINVS